MTIRKIRKGCDRCIGLGDTTNTTPARYRTLIDRFLCDECYPIALKELRPAEQTEASPCQ